MTARLSTPFGANSNVHSHFDDATKGSGGERFEAYFCAYRETHLVITLLEQHVDVADFEATTVRALGRSRWTCTCNDGHLFPDTDAACRAHARVLCVAERDVTRIYLRTDA